MNKDNDIYDICIIGGGINGAGIANYASALGLKVYLCEKSDFAAETSSSSTKLIHGGIRYLEYYEFNLVKKALKERAELEGIASHIIWPMEFVLINNPKVRSKLIVRLGLLLYDFLAGLKNKYKTTKTVNLLQDKLGYNLDLELIAEKYKNNKNITGFIYTDLWVDDARLTLLNILAAKENGASVYKNRECIAANYNVNNDYWDIDFKLNSAKHSGKIVQIKSKLIINAAGPWVNKVISQAINLKPNHNIRLIKGSHIIVNKLYSGPQCYVLQNDDKRIIFTIPYQEKYTLIGTTEEEISSSELNKKPEISKNEQNYLIKIINDFFKKKLTSDAIIMSYSGMRPLISEQNCDKSSNTRDFLIDNYNKNLINIYGGKITTYRVLAKDIIKIIINSRLFNINIKKKADINAVLQKKLPGSGIPYRDFIAQYPWLEEALAKRYYHTYGGLSGIFLNNCNSLDDLGQLLGGDIYSKEIDYLIQHEFATTLEDIIWRRTKVGLHIDLQTKENIKDYISKFC